MPDVTVTTQTVYTRYCVMNTTTEPNYITMVARGDLNGESVDAMWLSTTFLDWYMNGLWTAIITASVEGFDIVMMGGPLSATPTTTTKLNVVEAPQ